MLYRTPQLESDYCRIESSEKGSIVIQERCKLESDYCRIERSQKRRPHMDTTELESDYCRIERLLVKEVPSEPASTS